MLDKFIEGMKGAFERGEHHHWTLDDAVVVVDEIEQLRRDLSETTGELIELRHAIMQIAECGRGSGASEAIVTMLEALVEVSDE